MASRKKCSGISRLGAACRCRPLYDCTQCKRPVCDSCVTKITATSPDFVGMPEGNFCIQCITGFGS